MEIIIIIRKNNNNNNTSIYKAHNASTVESEAPGRSKKVRMFRGSAHISMAMAPFLLYGLYSGHSSTVTCIQQRESEGEKTRQRGRGRPDRICNERRRCYRVVSCNMKGSPVRLSQCQTCSVACIINRCRCIYYYISSGRRWSEAPAFSGENKNSNA